MEKIAVLIFITLLSGTPLLKAESPDSSKIDCYITVSIIGGYAGYFRSGIKLTENESSMKAEVYSPGVETYSFTEFNEEGEIVGFAIPDQLDKTRYIKKSEIPKVSQILDSLYQLKEGMVPEFNARRYRENHGNCEQTGYWVHIKTEAHNWYLFGEEGGNLAMQLFQIIEEGKKREPKMKSR